MQAEDINMEDLIPQRDPVVVVGRLISAHGHTTITEFKVRDDHLFVSDGHLQESGLIENIAQTAAALNGYQARLQGGEVRKGFIGGIKNLRIIFLPAVGSTITTKVTEEHNVMDTSIIKGEVSLDGRLAASCEMKVFLNTV